VNRTALIYDFDGTLAKGNVQEHSFLPDLGISSAEFWAKVKRRAEEHDADEILTYMWLMLEAASAAGKPVTREAIEQHGHRTPLFEGVEQWFDRINAYGAERGLDIEHYIVSSGNLELIRGSPITRHFRHVFASKFIYDEGGRAVWPGMAINYTTKTQFLFRINKGIDNSWDGSAINRWIPMDERPVPFERMIFIGDGDTDIPAMKMVRYQGGHSIAVFDPDAFTEARHQEKLHRLIAEDRVHHVAPADYTAGSQLDVVIRGILGRIARESGFRS
jgi:phosphoserine phosphatase